MQVNQLLMNWNTDRGQTFNNGNLRLFLPNVAVIVIDNVSRMKWFLKVRLFTILGWDLNIGATNSSCEQPKPRYAIHKREELSFTYVLFHIRIVYFTNIYYLGICLLACNYHYLCCINIHLWLQSKLPVCCWCWACDFLHIPLWISASAKCK